MCGQEQRTFCRGFRFNLIGLVLLGLSLSHYSQGAESVKVSGTVTDPVGEVVSGARVAIRNADESTAQSGTTNAEGQFEVWAPAGHYRLVIEAPGFKSFVGEDLNVGSAESSQVDVRLQVESQSESVVVNSDSPAMDTTSTQIGEEISQKKMIGVPLNGRSFTDLLALQPGVVPASSAQSNAVVMSGCSSTPPSGDLNPGNMSVSGQRETANGFAVNGSSVEEDFNNAASVIPNLDSIAEFRVLTSNFDAEYGNFSGGQVLVTTKTGTNQLHGSGFEFFRDTSLDAENCFAQDRAQYDRHQYGGTVGGPVVRDNLFFFADYQGTNMTQGIERGLISVPSSRLRMGDLSDSASKSKLKGSRVSGNYLAALLAERLGLPVTAGEPYYFQRGDAAPDGSIYSSDCVSGTQCVFPGAQIPSAAWSAPAKALLAYIPKPNAGEGSFADSSQNQILHDNKAALRADWATSKGVFSAYYFADAYDLDNPYPTSQGGASVPGFNATSEGLAQLINLGWTKPWGASTVNELHFSYMRSANVIGQPVGGVGPSLASQGFEEGDGTLGIVPLNKSIEGIENVSFNDFTIGVDVTGEQQVNNTYQLTDSLTRVVGQHSLKFGANLHLDQVNIRSNSINNGAFMFQGSETGLDFADYIIGTASNYEQGDASPFYIRNKYAGVIGQDSWKATRNLTVNYGLRWDVLPPWHEKYNQLQTFVLGEQSVVYPGAPAGIVFPGDRGIPDTLAPAHWTDFSPRLGLAYSPDFAGRLLGTIFGSSGKSSIRVGYGIFHTAIEGLSAGIMSACAPYGYDYDSTGGRPLFSEPFRSASTGTTNGQPFPSPIPSFGASPRHPNNTVDWSKYSPITGDPAYYYGNTSPYTESYTVSIERELRSNTILKLGYVGAGAHHLLVLTPADPGDAALCKSVILPSQVQPGTRTCGPFSEGGMFARADGAQLTVRGPFGAAFDGITYQKTIGNSSFNAFEATLRHTGKSVDLLAGYTYSKSLDNSSSLSEEVNPIDPRSSRAVSAFDVRQNFVASYKYDLPVADVFRVQSRWTQGWSVSGITRLSSGMPVTLYNNDDTSLLGSIPNGINNNGVDTPDYTPGNLRVNTDPRNGRSAFNTALISIPQSIEEYGHVGTARRRFFYGPGLQNFDLSVQKRTDLGESKSLELRVESFNVFNHAQFFGPEAVNGNPDSTNFGSIVNADAPRQMQVAAKFYF